VAGVAPDPKSHAHVTPITVPVLVKSTLYPVHLGAFDVKLAFGVSLIVIVCVADAEHPNSFFKVKVTVLVPDEL